LQCCAEIGVCDHCSSHPFAQLLALRWQLQPFVEQEDATPVFVVADAAAERLIDGSGRRLLVPTLTIKPRRGRKGTK
jgi:hypothetical protein